MTNGQTQKRPRVRPVLSLFNKQMLVGTAGFEPATTTPPGGFTYTFTTPPYTSAYFISFIIQLVTKFIQLTQ